MRKRSKTNTNPTGKAPKKMDSNCKMETQKIPQYVDKGGGHSGGSAMVGRGSEQ